MARDLHSKDLWTLNDRGLSIIVFALYFSWLLAFPFEGQILYAVAAKYNFDVHAMLFGSIAAHFAGLLICGFLIKTIKAAKKLMIFSIAFSMVTSIVFFFPPSILWPAFLMTASFLAGTCVAAWGYFLKGCTPSNERIKTAADGLIYSNILMIVLNMSAIHVLPHVGLGLALVTLSGALFFALKLPVNVGTDSKPLSKEFKLVADPVKPLAFLCLFIVVITINSGLMYQVINPAFAHLEWLVSWYWAVPYIIALYLMKNLPEKTNRSYILYVAIAMIGFSFIFFMIFDRSPGSYLLVNTLMLGACGVYDLFWWSILGEMLDFADNPAKFLGWGLSANVLGVLIGGIAGNAIMSADVQKINPSLLALGIVFIILIILPLLHQRLSLLLKNHVYLREWWDMSQAEQKEVMGGSPEMEHLTDREKEIAALLLKGRTYKMIASELNLSENTVKTHIKNIYSKLNIQSKTELLKLVM